jgi:hypothetical protein
VCCSSLQTALSTMVRTATAKLACMQLQAFTTPLHDQQAFWAVKHRLNLQARGHLNLIFGVCWLRQLTSSTTLRCSCCSWLLQH